MGMRIARKPDISEIIAEFTGVRGVERATVWLYGEVLWVHTQHFDYEAERHGRTKQVQIITSPLVKRYRDGEGSMFLIEIPRTMAEVLKLEDFVLDGPELERFKGRIDTSEEPGSGQWTTENGK
jgi:hypothetical protein